ncbi:MAG: gas vesicle protein GvpK [Actinomycetes bacterium]
MIDVEQDDLKKGLLGLVFALVEIIQEVLAHTALDRVERGSLTDEEVERIGNAMADIEEAIAELKDQLGITEATREIRDQLDDLVGDLVNTLIGVKGVTDGQGRHAVNLG